MGKNNKFQNKQHFELVPRPMDDPLYYDENAPKFILMPTANKTKARKQEQNMNMMMSNIMAESKSDIPELVTTNPYIKKSTTTEPVQPVDKSNEKLGRAADYGIMYDDKEYDYLQHLKPIGEDPNAVFVAAPGMENVAAKKEVTLEELFGDLMLKEGEEQPNFEFGRATDAYLERQVDILDSLKGFKPDMDPRIKEVLTALDDEAYVVNKDTEINEEIRKKLEKEELDLEEIVEADSNDEDFFNELLQGGKGDDLDEIEENQDNWDLDEFDDQYYDDENYNADDHKEEAIIKKEIVNTDDPFNIENIAKLNEISWGQDMRNMKKEQKGINFGFGKDQDLDSMDNFGEEIYSEDEDDFGDLPTFSNAKKTGNNSRKQRRKKGAMSDVSGFSMSSSAIPRTEIMTILDDKFDQVIGGYENYEEEQYDDDYEEFDMNKERGDLENLLDDFLDTYELAEGGRKLAKKSETADKIQLAADIASKNNKHSKKRLKELGMLKDETASKKKSNAW
ncbi:uncharacterized protein HGUI_03079 [Hanseniaspora guilliermondii]|uniref:Protein LTV1 n=1 Tax=Hanseniaspora guilliermondii TaxID=56406 RepID=A0A1L0D169_9ASCO|nr:uncharacterized protein HGUI_03079 [Hanseniaspora guilliermondii]